MNMRFLIFTSLASLASLAHGFGFNHPPVAPVASACVDGSVCPLPCPHGLVGICSDGACTSCGVQNALPPPLSGCTADTDCGSTSFCRASTNDYNGPKACVAFSPAGASCGGMMPPQYQTRCSQGLECVNTMGPMIMDAGGQCGPACDSGSSRDQWGNCIQAGCRSWFDGCNTCRVANGRAGGCTENMCYQVAAGSATCHDETASAGGSEGARCVSGFSESGISMPCAHGLTCVVRSDTISMDTNYGTCSGAAATTSGPPAGCTTWFDGCNTCGRSAANAPMQCTMMACFTQGASECRGWAPGYGPSAVVDHARPVDPLPPQGNPACWSGRFNYNFCCANGGNAACWGGQYTQTFCCSAAGH